MSWEIINEAYPDRDWEGTCAVEDCDAPIDLDNCSHLFEGTDPDGIPIMLCVCSGCAYLHRLTSDVD